MTQTLPYQQMGRTDRGQAHALFSQTMAYVALTAALFALGAWLGRNLTGAVGIIAFIAAFIVLFAMRSAAQRSASIFLDILNVFLFFLSIFSGGEER